MDLGIASDNRGAADSYDEHAFAWATRLRSGNNPAHRFLEKPAMYSMLPDLTGARVLCIGCGSGEELDMLMAKRAGAQNIVGIDVSEKLIEIARGTFPQATFHVRDMADLADFSAESFDYVYSSLTFHYSDDWSELLGQIRRILSPGGRLLFSTHHPVKWGSKVERSPALDTFMMGYDRPAGEDPVVYGDYLNSRRIQDQWFGSMSVEYFHRPLDAIFNDVLGSGLRLVSFREPRPTAEAETENPAFWSIHTRIPLFMIFELEK